MMLDSDVFLLTMYHGLARYSAGFVQKMFTSLSTGVECWPRDWPVGFHLSNC